MTVVVRFEEVSKTFGDVVALSDVTFDIGSGMTALLGPNGAGKSTMMRLICGLTTPDDGRIDVFGTRPRRDLRLHRRIGLVPQQEELLGSVDAIRFVRSAAELHGVGEPARRARAALERVDLDPDLPRPLATYSKGMRQRVKLAQALVHDPELLVLDEPLNGLDPVQRIRMIALFRELAADGRTVLVSSHVLDEVERFGSRILLMVRGRIVAEGDFHGVREALDDRPRRVRVRTAHARRVASGLLEREAADGVTVETGDTLLVDTSDIARFRRAVAEVAAGTDSRLYEVVPLDESLESVFRDLVVRRL
ncbi:MAG: ABC transporter ATP-binding protein [Actinobacteria bacterium]|nr:ABC transporter ATP-binding protein [Actinomycetota bacterium]